MNIETIRKNITGLADKPMAEKIAAYNELSGALYDMLGIAHPALNVQLIPVDQVESNDYNPNKVAPPEMRLLKLSIKKNGVTMPVVVAPNGPNKVTVVDGFHRTTTIKTDKEISSSLHGHVPATLIDEPRENRIAATVRHNMARGSHQIELSANLVGMLKKHNWSNARIGKELGMDADEVLRLRQTTGLAEAFADEEFSAAWEMQNE